MFHHNWKIWLFGILGLYLTAGGVGCNPAAAKGEYRTQEVKRLTIDAKVVANGTVTPYELP